MATIHFESSFVDVIFFDSDLMISIGQIQLCENFGLAQAFYELIYPWERKPVFNRLLVEGIVVNTYLPTPILLWRK